MTLNELLETLNLIEIEDTKLYLITRVSKPNVSKKKPVFERYLFNVYQADSDKDVRKNLLESTKGFLRKIIEKGFEMIDYDIMADDTDHLFSYSIKNKKFSFSDIVVNKLGKTNVPKVKKLSEIENSTESLWAYCYEFETADGPIYTFRKISNTQVGVSASENPERNLFSKGIRLAFDSESMKLELLKKETLTFDKNIDCVYYNEVFYILKKSNFETLVGLQEYFKEEALRIAESMNQTEYIEMSPEIKSIIEKKPSTHKKLIKVEKTKVYQDLDPKKIQKMDSICKRFGEKLPVENGKIIVKNDYDLDVLLKMCTDYHKKGLFSGLPYGTFHGKVLTPKL